MAPGSSNKAKSARGKKNGLGRWIVGWTIEEGTTPDYLNVSLRLVGAPDDPMCAVTTQHYLVQRERMADLIAKLTGGLEEVNAVGREEERMLAADSQVVADSVLSPAPVGDDNSDLLSSHFALGAYGLVGN